MKNSILRLMILVIASFSLGCSGGSDGDKQTPKMEATKNIQKKPK